MNPLYLFDFDGVIADSFALYEKFVASCLNAVDPSLSLSRNDFMDLFDDNVYEAIAKRGIPTDVFFEAAASFGPLDYSVIQPFPDVVPVLEDLAREHLLVIISSNQSGTIEDVLTRANMTGIFQAILGADHMTSKTDKIAYAMKNWNRRPEETYYIGDTAGDVREANRAGVRSVAVTWGWHDETRLKAAGPRHIVRTPGELIGLDGKDT